jgi:hypothetical protein
MGVQLNTQTVEPDRQQLDLHAAGVIAQQFSSATIFLSRFHSANKDC